MAGEYKFFIESEYCCVSEKGQKISGDVCMPRRRGNHNAVVLADGAGSGVKANVTAEVIASMAVSYTMSGVHPKHAAEVILQTFSGSGAGAATFTIVDIMPSGEVLIAEAGNPPCIVIRNGQEFLPQTEICDLEGHEVRISSFRPMIEDRIILFSDGVSMSGRMTSRLPEGWGREGVSDLCRTAIASDPMMSARDMCRKIISQAELNELFSPRNDMTCAVVYLRQPRSIIVSSGPPYNENKDDILADLVSNYNGTRLVCGGTTAQIIARELDRAISVSFRRDPAGLPPTSRMEGVDLITEGVLTLSKVKRALEASENGEVPQKGTDGIVARMLLEHDVVEFVVGTRINPVHQDPNLPVELELRRNLIRDLAAILENKFMKEVKVQYI